MLRGLNLNDNNELIYQSTVLEKQVGKGALEIQHSPEGYKKHHEEIFGEIINVILNCPNKRYSEFSK